MKIVSAGMVIGSKDIIAGTLTKTSAGQTFITDKNNVTKGVYPHSVETMFIKSDNKWIPCSERLPEDTTTKAITLSNGAVEGGYYSEGKWWCIGDGIRLVVNADVIAWMPLPEPYIAE